LRTLLISAVKNAAAELILAREAEGIQLISDVRERLSVVSVLAEDIAQKEDLVLEEYRVKLEQRITTLLETVPVDETRLAQEVAIYADKCNVTEEVVRIKSHVNQFLDAVTSGLPQGRNLDFIVQELNREFNTIGRNRKGS
jgi:uncharacterized protein (TIGR00255 family)